MSACLQACLGITCVHAWCPWKTEDVKLPRTGVTDGCEASCGVDGGCSLAFWLPIIEMITQKLY